MIRELLARLTAVDAPERELDTSGRGVDRHLLQVALESGNLGGLITARGDSRWT